LAALDDFAFLRGHGPIPLSLQGTRAAVALAVVDKLLLIELPNNVHSLDNLADNILVKDVFVFHE
jgi:hypothetical protein